MADIAVDEVVTSKDDVLDFLVADDKESDEKVLKELPDEKVESEEEPEEKEEVEAELKLESSDEEDFAFADVPRRKEILKEFPELFKKFPTIEKAIYREQEYARLFPTLSEAKEAQEEVNNFKQFQTELFSGDITGILKSVKTSDEKAFGKIADNLLDTLRAVDNSAWLNTVGGLVSNALHTVFTEAKKSGGEDGEQLEIAARLINKFFFSSTEIKPSVRTEPIKDERADELSNREKQFAQQQLQTAVNDITERVDGSITKAVKEAIDPKGVMSSYVKNKAIEDVMSQARKEMLEEPRFRAMYDRMWLDSAKNNFNAETKNKIKDVLLKRAKAILPDVLRRVKADALKGSSARIRTEKTVEKDEEDVTPIKRESRAPSKKEPARGMRTLDFLNQD